MKRMIIALVWALLCNGCDSTPTMPTTIVGSVHTITQQVGHWKQGDFVAGYAFEVGDTTVVSDLVLAYDIARHRTTSARGAVRSLIEREYQKVQQTLQAPTITVYGDERIIDGKRFVIVYGVFADDGTYVTIDHSVHF